MPLSTSLRPLRPSHAVLVALALLYAAQGVPYGFAAEYLPVAMRQEHYKLGTIALLGVVLQLPWQLKFLWAQIADRPKLRANARLVLLGLQLTLFVVLTGFAIKSFHDAPRLWFALTFVAAFFASTQDIFVDSLAVRSLDVSQRGFGNTAQVGGYRLGMLAGGAGLLLLMAPLGSRGAVLVCSSFVLFTALSAFVLRDTTGEHEAPASRAERRLRALALAKHMVQPKTWPVVVLALTYKIGLHMAAFLIKPIVVDAHWTDREIGFAVVTAGTTAGLIGAVAGGALHRVMHERRALAFGAIVQSLVCIPLLAAHLLGAPRGWTTVAIIAEHFVTGVGTTVLFAALMSATRKSDAGLHYTLLTSANVLAIGIGSTLGGFVADVSGKSVVLVIAVVACLAPLWLISRWDAAMTASADEPAE